jgi:prepilin-type processing-associated H-X9-DG protein
MDLLCGLIFVGLWLAIIGKGVMMFVSGITARKPLRVALGAVLALCVAAFPFLALQMMARAKEAARIATCQVYMRHMGMALRMYMDENFDTLPSSVVCGSTDTVFRKTLGKSLTAKQPETLFQLLYPYLRKEDSYHCPSDCTGKPSYILKKAINDAWLDPKIKARTETDFTWPARQIVFYERGSFHWANISGDVSDPKNTRKLGAAVNCFFFDGHVQKVRLTKFEPDYYNTDGSSDKPATRPQINPLLYRDTLE